METELSTTQIALLEAIKASLFGTEPNYPADTDWAEIVKEAKAQTVLGIISPVIPVKEVSVEMGKATYMRLMFEQDKLIKLLDSNDIPCVILKGYAAAQYYPKPYLRAMGDVDFLVPHDKFEKAIALLENNGYSYHHGKNQKDVCLSRDICYKKNGIEFELHHHFGSFGFDVDDILNQAIINREYREMDGYKIPMLSDFENGLVLLGHMNHHLISHNLGLRQILDWEMFVHNALDDTMWNEQLLPLLNSIGLKKLSINITVMCMKYLGLNCSLDLDTDLDEGVPTLLLEMIFDNGNFGNKKKASLQNENDSLVSYGLYNIKRNGFFPYFQDIGLRKWQLCQRYKSFRPFAWIYGMGSALIRGIPSMIKHGSVMKQIVASKEKYVLYEKLGIEANLKNKRLLA